MVYINVLCVERVLFPGAIKKNSNHCALKRNIKNHADYNIYHRALCGKGFIHWNHMKRFMKIHTRENYITVLCVYMTGGDSRPHHTALYMFIASLALLG